MAEPTPAEATPAEPTPAEATAAEVWELLVDVVMASRHDGPRRVAEAFGMPFSRVRALKTIAEGAQTMGELARTLEVDSSAATGMVNALEERGLAVRALDPGNRRVRVVSITPAGRALLARTRRVEVPAPAGIDGLPADELAELDGILRRISAGSAAARSR